ncbi:MAG: endonuclease IV, partial [Ruminococcus sp.]|nr:endonuclease IV [Ruminococcus sp.]
AKMLDMLENGLGADRAKVFHSHFSKIEFTVPGGEKRHVTFADNNGFGPDYEPLLEEIYRRGWSPVIICESAGTQTEDAAEMKGFYEKLGK